MRYVAAYLLAVLGGNKTPSSDDVEKILSSVGIEAEKEKLNIVLKELAGKDVKAVIELGKTKLSSMPSGGGGGGGGGAPAAAGGGGAAKKEAPAAKKEEKKEEEKEESDEDMGFGLFD